MSSNSSYILEPVPDSPNQHLIYRLDDLKLQRGACGYQGTEDTAKDWLRGFTTGIKPLHQRVSRAQTGSMHDAPNFLPVPSLKSLLFSRIIAWKVKCRGFVASWLTNNGSSREINECRGLLCSVKNLWAVAA